LGKKVKEQRLTFVVRQQGDKTSIQSFFYPPLANSEEAFNKMPIERRMVQNYASNICRYVMERLAKDDEDSKKTTSGT
jgi:hypothetical protein